MKDSLSQFTFFLPSFGLDNLFFNILGYFFLIYVILSMFFSVKFFRINSDFKNGYCFSFIFLFFVSVIISCSFKLLCFSILRHFDTIKPMIILHHIQHIFCTIPYILFTIFLQTLASIFYDVNMGELFVSRVSLLAFSLLFFAVNISIYYIPIRFYIFSTYYKYTSLWRASFYFLIGLSICIYIFMIHIRLNHSQIFKLCRTFYCLALFLISFTFRVIVDLLVYLEKISFTEILSYVYAFITDFALTGLICYYFISEIHIQLSNLNRSGNGYERIYS